MTAKEYLSQARYIDLRIKNMTIQLQSLKAAAVNISPVYSDMPRPATRNVHKTEDAIISVMDLEKEKEKEFVRLAAIHKTISEVSAPVRQAILLNRYIKGQSWDEISFDLKISLSRIYQIHKESLSEVESILSKDVTL